MQRFLRIIQIWFESPNVLASKVDVKTVDCGQSVYKSRLFPWKKCSHHSIPWTHTYLITYGWAGSLLVTEINKNVIKMVQLKKYFQTEIPPFVKIAHIWSRSYRTNLACCALRKCRFGISKGPRTATWRGCRGRAWFRCRRRLPTVDRSSSQRRPSPPARESCNQILTVGRNAYSAQVIEWWQDNHGSDADVTTLGQHEEGRD